MNTVWLFMKILTNDIISNEEDIKPKFSEFDSPSFDSQIETMGKARTNNVLSVETMVDELYGDSKSDEWKKEEVLRIKNEIGINIVDEPSISQDGFNLEASDELSDG